MSKKDKIDKHDILMKVLALIIAILLWSYVMGEVNPEKKADFKVNVEYKGKDILEREGLMIIDPEELAINVTVSGPKSEVEDFSANKLSATVDLSNCKEGKNEVEVKLSRLESVVGINIVDYPKTIIFTIDRVETKERDVIVKTEGKPKQDYIVGDIELDPETITLTGPKSYIEKIDQVVAHVDLEGKTDSIRESFPIELLDKNGVEIEGSRRIVKSRNEINVYVPIYKSIDVPIDIKTVNRLPEQYNIKSMKIEPSYVGIRIKHGGIVNKLETKPIDLLSLLGSSSQEVELVIPDNIELEDPNQKFVIKYEIEEIGSKTYSYEYSDIELRNVPGNVEVTLGDLEGFVNIALNISHNNIPKNDIKPYVDLQGLELGTHELEIMVDDLPAGAIKSISPETMKVNLERRN